MNLSRHERRARVEQRFPRYRWDSNGRTRWDRPTSQYLQAVTVACVFAILFLDRPLLGFGARHSSHGAFALSGPEELYTLAFASFALASGFLLDRYLAGKTHAERQVPLWLRALRLSISTVPVLGIVVVPAWRSILSRQPAWGFRESPPPPLETGRRPPRPTSFLERLDRWRRTRAQRFPWLVAWIILGEIVPFLGLVTTLAAAGERSERGRMACLVGSVVCHAVACTAALRYGWLRRRELRARGFLAWRLQLSPFLLLLPEFSFLGLLPWWTGMAENREETTLLHRLGQTAGRAPQLLAGAAGEGLLARLRRALRVLNAPLDGAEEMRRTLYRLKALFVLLEGAAVGWILVRRLPGLRPSASLRVLAIPTSLAALGLVVEGALVAKASTRSLVVRAQRAIVPSGRYLFVTQLALAAGLLLGFTAAWDVGLLGKALEALGLCGVAALSLLYGPLSPFGAPSARQFQTLLAWTLLFFVLFLAGATFEGEQSLPTQLSSRLQLALLVAPVASCALGLAFLPWLLRPLGLRQLIAARTPRRLRAILAGLTITALIPLGGLAIPGWITARRGLERANREP